MTRVPSPIPVRPSGRCCCRRRCRRSCWRCPPWARFPRPPRRSRRHCPDPRPRVAPPQGGGVLASSGFGRPLRRLPVPASRRPPRHSCRAGSRPSGTPPSNPFGVVGRWRPRRHGNRLRHDDPRPRHLPLEYPSGVDRGGRRMDGRTPPELGQPLLHPRPRRTRPAVPAGPGAAVQEPARSGAIELGRRMPPAPPSK